VSASSRSFRRACDVSGRPELLPLRPRGGGGLTWKRAGFLPGCILQSGKVASARGNVGKRRESRARRKKHARGKSKRRRERGASSTFLRLPPAASVIGFRLRGNVSASPRCLRIPDLYLVRFDFFLIAIARCNDPRVARREDGGHEARKYEGAFMMIKGRGEDTCLRPLAQANPENTYKEHRDRARRRLRTGRRVSIRAQI